MKDVFQIDGVKVRIITDELFKDLLRDKLASIRNKDKTGLCDAKEGAQILSCHLNTFYNRANSRGTLIRKGNVNGTYLRQSIYAHRDKRN